MRRARHHARVVTSSRSSLFVAALSALLLPAAARAAAWEDATMATIGVTAEWSNKVELADIDGDGRVDILFANGAGYSAPEAPKMNRAFLNQGPVTPFLDTTRRAPRLRLLTRTFALPERVSRNQAQRFRACGDNAKS